MISTISSILLEAIEADLSTSWEILYFDFKAPAVSSGEGKQCLIKHNIENLMKNH
jgi:hypothetical protein